MSVTMMLVMLALLAMLGLVEIGYLFWAKRDAQKVADLAALAGAQRLELCTSDNNQVRELERDTRHDQPLPGHRGCGQPPQRRAGHRAAKRAALLRAEHQLADRQRAGGGAPLRAHCGVRRRLAAAADPRRFAADVDPAPDRPGCHQRHGAFL
ncbi:hypothetical protein G6F50_015574 [Rhizopus delemar]|uniref:Putative Flp pilus-assembly TadG-like N-terminal domain-containing protein n=1 Tax=Rhizopus delemar TaxID=936053 RepID=A0A9P7C378_9FUNG|nr:hypothetical protein G6F50_015574 [Rhizopus delemar]